MSWCNVLQRAGSDYCVNDNFQGPLPIFVERYLLNKKLVHMVIHGRKTFKCNVSFQMPCQSVW